MKIAAVIVTYNPEPQILKKNILSIINQVNELYIYDNHSLNIDDIENLIQAFDIQIFKNKTNKGISFALNFMFNYVYDKDIDWIITLDQDSISPKNMIKEFKKYIFDNTVGIICPHIVDRNGNLEKEISNSRIEYIDKCITSGSMNRVASWKKIGGFDNNLFIDEVDTDYCMNLSKHGYKILRVDSVHLSHAIGQISTHKFLFWKVYTMNHNAQRKYYIARNIIYIARKYDKSKLLALLRVVKQIILVTLFEKNKIPKVKKILSGFKDGNRIRIDR